MIYFSHAPDQVARLADHVVLLSEGTILACGPIADITSRLDLSIALEDGAGAVIEGKVESYNEKYQLAQLRVARGVIQIEHRNL